VLLFSREVRIATAEIDMVLTRMSIDVTDVQGTGCLIICLIVKYDNVSLLESILVINIVTRMQCDCIQSVLKSKRQDWKS